MVARNDGARRAGKLAGVQGGGGDQRPGDEHSTPTTDAVASAERQIIGALLIDAAQVAPLIEVRDLLDPRHVAVAAAVLALRAGGDDCPSLAAVVDRVRGRHGVEPHLLVDLMEEATVLGGPAAAVSAARVVAEHAERRRLLAVAQRVQTAAAGGATADELRAIVAEADGDDAQRRPDDYPASSWGAVASAAAVEWLVPGWIPERSTGFLFGHPSAGKSFVVLDIAAHMATGQPWFGVPVQPGPTLWLVGEGEAGARARIAAWRREHQVDDDAHALDVVDGVPPLVAESWPIYRRIFDDFARRHGRPPQLAWIDTFGQGLPGGENDDSAVLPALRIMGDLRRVCGSSVWAVAHPRKLAAGDADRPLTAADLRGHGALRGNVDGLIACDHVKGRRQLVAHKVKDGAEPPPIAFDLLPVETGRYRKDGSAETSCVVVPAAPGVEADPVDEERQRRDAAEAMAREVVRVLVADLGGRTSSKDAVYGLMRGKTDRKRAALATALDRDWIRPSGPRDERAYEVTDAGRVVCGVSPYTPQGRGGAEAPARTPSAPDQGAERGGEGRKGRNERATA